MRVLIKQPLALPTLLKKSLNKIIFKFVNVQSNTSCSKGLFTYHVSQKLRRPDHPHPLVSQKLEIGLPPSSPLSEKKIRNMPSPPLLPTLSSYCVPLKFIKWRKQLWRRKYPYENILQIYKADQKTSRTLRPASAAALPASIQTDYIISAGTDVGPCSQVCAR